MHLVADGIGIISGCSDKKVQRLHPRIAGALRHNIKELSVGLRMKLIKYHSMRIKAVLVCHIRRQHLIRRIRRLIYQLLLRFQYLYPL